jgi:predicted nucleotidyltransferase
LLLPGKSDKINAVETKMVKEPKLYRMTASQRYQAAEAIKTVLSTLEEVRFAFLFGSFSDDAGEASIPFHDIDLGIYLRGFAEKPSVHYALNLTAQLSSLLEVPIDVRVMNFAPLSFLFHVVRGRLLIDKDEDARCAFMEWVVRHYLDMEPLLHRAIKEAYG